MLVKLISVATVGLDPVPVEVEVDVASAGFPGFTIVGLAGKAVEEARERVKTAIINSGFDFPPKKITVNLAPADLPKDGGAYDLPIALGILAASEQCSRSNVQYSIFYGELSLDGSLRQTKGVLLVGLFAKSLNNSPLHPPLNLRGGTEGVIQTQIFVPKLSANEAAVVEGINVFPVSNLKQLVDHLSGRSNIQVLKHLIINTELDESPVDFDLAEVAGQEMAKRALTIAAAGGHNLLMWGPPGTGKTMMARSVPGILPPLSVAEALEVTRVYSVSGLMEAGESLVRRRPFRSPHHGISSAGMVGGGSNPLPGEVSLAHLGVLFLDEMPEFTRSVLESLRQPMERGEVEIVRAAAHVRYPASFTLVAAVNPCPCGYLGHPRRACTCSEKQIRRYKQRLSGPILDRIDLHVAVPAVEVGKLELKSVTHSASSGQGAGEQGSKVIRGKVVLARKVQERRFLGKGMYTNSQMRNKEVKEFCKLGNEVEQLLRMAVEKYDLSARAYFRLIKVARTIADLGGLESIEVRHMAEALQYRQVT